MWSATFSVWSCGVMVSTWDSESQDPSSNLGRTFFFFFFSFFLLIWALKCDSFSSFFFSDQEFLCIINALWIISAQLVLLPMLRKSWMAQEWCPLMTGDNGCKFVSIEKQIDTLHSGTAALWHRITRGGGGGTLISPLFLRLWGRCLPSPSSWALPWSYVVIASLSQLERFSTKLN